MKFTIEVDDFWMEEEELTDALKHHIKMSVINDVTKNIKDLVEERITKRVNEHVKNKLDLIIDETLLDQLETGNIVINKKPISIRNHVKDLFQKDSGWRGVGDQIKRLAKTFADDLKIQYGNAFASKIVSNMKEQGLLKDDVVKMLLTDTERKT